MESTHLAGGKVLVMLFLQDSTCFFVLSSNQTNGCSYNVCMVSRSPSTVVSFSIYFVAAFFVLFVIFVHRLKLYSELPLVLNFIDFMFNAKEFVTM